MRQTLLLLLISILSFSLNAQVKIEYKIHSNSTQKTSEKFGLLKVVDIDAEHYLTIISNYDETRVLAGFPVIVNQELQLTKKDNHSVDKSVLISDITIAETKFIQDKLYLFGRDKVNSFYACEFDLKEYTIKNKVLLIDGENPDTDTKIPQLIVPTISASSDKHNLSVLIFTSEDESKFAVVQKEIGKKTTAIFRIKVYDNDFNLVREDEIRGGNKTGWLHIKAGVLSNEGEFFAQFESLRSGYETIVTKDEVFGDNSHKRTRKSAEGKRFNYPLFYQNDTLSYYSYFIWKGKKKLEFKKTNLNAKLEVLGEETIFTDDGTNSGWWKNMRGIEKTENGNLLLISEAVIPQFGQNSFPTFGGIFITMVNSKDGSVKEISIDKRQYCSYEVGSFSYVLAGNLLHLIYNKTIKKKEYAIVVTTVNLETAEKYSSELSNFNELGCIPRKNNFFSVDDNSMIWFTCDTGSKISIDVE